MAEGRLLVQLEDGRTLLVPLEWFRGATSAQLADVRLLARGLGVSWRQLDEDLPVEGLLAPPARR